MQEDEHDLRPDEAADLAELVHDRASFFAFVEAMIRDRQRAVTLEAQEPSCPYGPDAGGWENVTIEAYLEAALAWAQDKASQMSEEPSWREFAEFLYVGKIYE